MKILLIILCLFPVLAYGADMVRCKDNDCKVISDEMPIPELSIMDDDAPCCTEDCIEYLLPRVLKKAIYMDCTDCERCLWERMVKRFNR